MDNRLIRMGKEIVRLRVNAEHIDVGAGNCPYAKYPTYKTRADIHCDKFERCSDCTDIWIQERAAIIAKEVAKEYELYADLEEQ